ncbi:restriction endonuclease subunit S [Mycolicibacter minnesotensis]
MSDLPKGWAWTTLGQLGSWRGGGTPSKRNPSFWEGGTISWLSPKDMGDTVLKGTQDHITESAVSESATSLIPADSVAIVVRSGILERTVPIALVPFETTLNQDMKAISPYVGVDSRWLLYALISQVDVILGTCRKDGTTVASIDTSRLRALPIPLPPLAEQHRIVELLEDHLSRLDAADGTLAAVARRIDALTDALAIDAVGVAPGAMLPQDWEWRSLESLSSGSSYGTSTKCDPQGQGTPVVRIPNIRGGALDLADMKYAVDLELHLDQLHLKAGDLLFVRTNGSPTLIGRTGVVRRDVAIAFASYLIRFQLGSVDVADWVHLVVSSPQWREQIVKAAASSAGQYNLNQTFLKRLQIPLPPVDMRTEILTAHSDAYGDLARLLQDSHAALSRSAALRRAVLRAAFNGELVDQDPNDEPAAVALERLRAESKPPRKRAAKRTAAASTRG